MSFRMRCIAALALALVARAPAAFAQSPPRALTSDEAVAQALADSPVLAARRAEVEQAEGRLRTAGTYPTNPELGFEAARRKSPDGSDTDHEIRLSQAIPIGGQRGRRTTLASAELEAARAGLEREQQLLAARVRGAHVEALRARELVDVERANTELAVSLSEVARKRFDAGASAQMDVNLAQGQLGRAERELRRAEGAYAVSRTLLAEVIGLDPAQPPEPAGELDAPAPPTAALEELLAGSALRRADLRALRHGLAAARARIELARREAVPDLELAAFAGREEGTDDLAGGAVGIAIPLFNRNRGAVAEAVAFEHQVQAEVRMAELAVRREVAETLARHRAAEAAAETLRRQVLGTLDENLALLQRSFEAGKTSWTEVLIFRREFVEVQREYVESATEARLAAIELELAAGTAQP